MNFLAHILLSGDDDEIILGNFIGDFVKGKELEKYPEKIKKGIELHRKIDHFTDRHSTVLASKKRLRPLYRHYAPVIADLFYDHFLAKNWQKYHPTDLKTFTASFYRMINNRLDQLPVPAKRMFTYMSNQDWLYHYQSIEGIDRALTGMSRRTRFDSGMETASKELQRNYQQYLDEFEHFFPHLQKMSYDFLND